MVLDLQNFVEKRMCFVPVHHTTLTAMSAAVAVEVNRNFVEVEPVVVAAAVDYNWVEIVVVAAEVAVHNLVGVVAKFVVAEVEIRNLTEVGSMVVVE